MKRFISLSIAAAFLSTSPSLAQTTPITKAPKKAEQTLAQNTLPSQLPIYNVTQSGASEQSAKALADFLGLRASPIGKNGILRYLDPEKFQKIPTKSIVTKVGEPDEDGQKTVAEGIDFTALKNTRILDNEKALARTKEALQKAGLVLIGGNASIGHSNFEAISVKGEKVVSTPLDTQVNYSFVLNRLKLVGPGAKVKFVFNGEGTVTQLFYAQRTLQQGKTVGIISQADADKLATTAYQKQGALGRLQLKSELVYYAPSLELVNAKQILPHYLYSGTASVKGQQVVLRQILIPAVPNSAPKVEIAASSQDSTISAKANVSGGTGPYTYVWSSSTTALDPKLAQSGASIQYKVERRQKGLVAPEIVSVTVTDANGLSVQASQTVQVTTASVVPTLPELTSLKSLGRVDVGIEWIGVSQGLGGSAGNAGGFVTRFSAEGIPVQFKFGDFSAWERDFKESTLGGNDRNYVDDVDLVFYTGHANGNGFTFSSSQDDGFLDIPSEGRWGDRDLEWIILAACGPLQAVEGGVSISRLFPAFKGLHILNGYSTVSNDNTDEGRLFANYILRSPFLWWFNPLKIREAWAQTAVDVQPSSVYYGFMGVYGSGGVSSYNDYFWGKGSVSPDLRGSNIYGFWIVRAPS
ncbi:SprB repeat-containing protein [Desmonostoc muscorum LEGE 12446]|uniref:SprB repeat-containing protein n=1 Tax=Desmonostoc muscorum LEGE 12446 TaxID=1828758 RepID=A0A8J7AJQ7_DESMC|nr:DUF6345 domain-containing protein [Desmonostoc muscorum]MCF2146847.1 SprB repeat-containing protein [Desmonostoc muscorum LEGE 12446]